MSGDNLHAPTRTTNAPRDSSAVPTHLLQRVRSTRRDGTPEEVMSAVADDLAVEDLGFDEEIVTRSLDEILIALVALRDDETHGTGLMEDIERIFDVQPSPGTVYPRLHDLADGGDLGRHELVQTKQYTVDDEAAVEERLEAAMQQHLALGLFLSAALDNL